MKRAGDALLALNRAWVWLSPILWVGILAGMLLTGAAPRYAFALVGIVLGSRIALLFVAIADARDGG